MIGNLLPDGKPLIAWARSFQFWLFHAIEHFKIPTCQSLLARKALFYWVPGICINPLKTGHCIPDDYTGYNCLQLVLWFWILDQRQNHTSPMKRKTREGCLYEITFTLWIYAYMWRCMRKYHRHPRYACCTYVRCMYSPGMEVCLKTLLGTLSETR